jgi:hypothetical protein
MTYLSLKTGCGANDGQTGQWHYGEELRESGEERAEGIIGAAFKSRGWTEQELRERRKGDKFKVRLANPLRAETTMTLKWTAERLSMGTRGYLAHLLYRRAANKM